MKSHLILSLAAAALTAFAAVAADSPSGSITLRFSAAAERYDAVKRQLGPAAASAIVSVDVRANALEFDASHPDAARVLALITRPDNRLAPVAPVAQEMVRDFGMIGIKICGPGDFRSIAEVWPDTPASKAGITAGDYILAIDGVDTKGSQITEFVGAIRGKPGTQVTLTLKRKDNGKIERITLDRISSGTSNAAKK
ncbi:MAG: PDZ domain-containing protein [Chthoniobacteraceae bacterium]